MQVVVDDILTSYDDTGKGQAVVFLHGWADSKQTFARLSKPLVNKYRVISVDLPGHGSTPAPVEAWDLSDYQAFVEHFLSKIGVESVFAIVGHSNGGAVAIKVVAAQNVPIEKLVLLASSGIRSGQTSRKKALKIVAKTGKFATAVLPNKMQNSIKDKFYKQIGSDALVLPHMRETFVNVVGEDLEQVAGTISIPTLLVYGSEDQDAPVEYGRAFTNRIAQSELIEIEGAGHFLHHTHETEVLKVLEPFLGRAEDK